MQLVISVLITSELDAESHFLCLRHYVGDVHGFLRRIVQIVRHDHFKAGCLHTIQNITIISRNEK